MLLRFIDKDQHYVLQSEVESLTQAREMALQTLEVDSTMKRAELWKSNKMQDRNDIVETWGQRDIDKEPMGIVGLMSMLQMTQAEFAASIGTSSRTISRCINGDQCPAWFTIAMRLMKFIAEKHGAKKLIELLNR